MATATKKSPAIENLLTSMTGRNRVQTVSQNKCVMCGGTPRSSEMKSAAENTASAECVGLVRIRFLEKIRLFNLISLT